MFAYVSNVSSGLAMFAVLAVGSAGGGEKLAECSELRHLEARWREAMTKMYAPSIAIAVVKGDQVLVCDAIGQRTADLDQFADADTMYYIASSTKTYVATALAALQAQGKVNLESPVKTYLPRFQLADAQAATTIIVSDLLCHKPGLSDWAIVFNDAYTGLITDDIYYRRLATCSPNATPQYSNVNFTLAGRVLESVSGKSWKLALDDVLFKPAGLTRTTGDADKMYADNNVALPLVWRSGGFVEAPRKSSRSMHAAGGLGTTARDAARYLLLSMNGGKLDGKQVVPEAAIRQALTPRQTMPPDGQIRRFDSFGLGWRLGTYRDRPYAAHQGGYVGASSHISFLTEEKIGVAILVNSDGPAGAGGLIDVISIDIFDALLGLQNPDLLPKYLERAATYPPQLAQMLAQQKALDARDVSIELASCAGAFSHPDFGTLRLSVVGERLHFELGDLRGEVLAAASKDTIAISQDVRQSYEGKLEIEGGKVRAVTFDFPSGETRFAAK
ncbi:MAG: serine hydrolase [Phycisphaerae bacterium]